MANISPQLSWGRPLIKKCEHGFSLPPVRYGETLLLPEICQSCRFGLAPGLPGIHIEQPHGHPPLGTPAQPYIDSTSSLERSSIPSSNVWPSVPGSPELRSFDPPPRVMLSPQLPSRNAEDLVPSEQTSSKNVSPFGVFVLEGQKRKHVVGRRGPLTDDAREKAKLLKSKGGACWRCKVLKKQVSLSTSNIGLSDKLSIVVRWRNPM